MGSLTAWHREVQERLNGALPAVFGPAVELPTRGGKVAQCAVLWPTPGTLRARSNGVVHQRTDSVNVVFVGATVLDCLAAVDKGRTALIGARLTASEHGGGLVHEAGFTGGTPTVEPGTDPVRVSLTVQLDAVTKEPA